MSTTTDRDVLARAASATLLALMVVGGFALWIGIPAAILWALGEVAGSQSEHYLFALIAIPTGMILFALLLIPLNLLYLRVNGVELETEDDDEEWLPRLRGPLDRILAACSVIALIVVLGWLLFGGQHPNGGTVW
jgi:hypothetical protein